MSKIFTRPVVYTLYTTSLILLFVAFVVLSNQPTSTLNPTQAGHGFNILSKFSLPVLNTKEMSIGKPYLDDGIVIVQNYYNHKDPEAEQRKSLIHFGDTFIQSRGVSYQLGEDTGFSVLAVLDGEVTEVHMDELIGNRITIKHSENVYSIYQSLDEINVAVGDPVEKGMIIGLSGTSNINSKLKNHLYFELLIDNIYVNPEEYYDKTL